MARGAAKAINNKKPCRNAGLLICLEIQAN